MKINLENKVVQTSVVIFEDIKYLVINTSFSLKESYSLTIGGKWEANTKNEVKLLG